MTSFAKGEWLVWALPVQRTDFAWRTFRCFEPTPRQITQSEVSEIVLTMSTYLSVGQQCGALELHLIIVRVTKVT